MPLSSCGAGAVEIDAPSLEGSAAAACDRLVDALPESVSDQPRRQVEPVRVPGAAWGDPAIVLTCGVPEPEGFDRFALCQETNGVGWFVPEAQIVDQSADVVMTTIGFEQNVEVTVPAQYRPPAAAMVDLAGPIKRSLSEPDPCV